jgi:WD40-like Beta Propeller Repeat
MRLRRLRSTAALSAALGATIACWPICDLPPAEAAFTPFTLASGDPARQLQADYAYDPAISADGAYVAFTGSVASKPGIYRKNLAPSGGLDLVAQGADMGAPSISADGRYISFTTDEDPVTGQKLLTGGQQPVACDSVYVRDMDKQSDEPGAYTLASARDGSNENLTYEPAATQGQVCGAAAAYRVALSANGREVAFTVLSQSNLAGPATPPEQVAVRDLDTQSTTLVSVTRASLDGTPQPVLSGAALAGATSASLTQLRNGTPVRLPNAASTAAISADGSTVAWMGVDIAEQTSVTSLPTYSHVDEYAEPLWRRIGEGPTAPTRRVLAGDDSSAPGCPPECAGGLDLTWDEAVEANLTEYHGAAPAYGSYVSAEESKTGLSISGFGGGLNAVTPQLSADGMEVALLSTQPDYGNRPEFGRLSHANVPPANAFVVSMVPGLSRAQAITRLTTWASPAFTNVAENGAVGDIAISPDGSRIVFTTTRTAFPLAPPALITPPISQATVSQLYEVNLPAGTLALVTQGYDGQPANEGVLGAALSGDGKVLALATGASNLAFGTINDGSDVFTDEEIGSPAALGLQSVSSPPQGPASEPSWSISVTVGNAPGGGGLLVDVSVPGAGSLSAGANASVPTTVPVVSRSRARRGKSRKRGKNASVTRAREVAVIATRQVARAVATTKSAGLVQLRLTPASRYRSLVSGKGGLYATITVTFTAPGRPRLTQTLQASFPRPHKMPTPKRKPGRPHVKPKSKRR